MDLVKSEIDEGLNSSEYSGEEAEEEEEEDEEFEPPRRKRTKLSRGMKWSDQMVNQILDYIIEHGAFQKPTCEVYYTKLLTHLKMDIPWYLAPQKMRHLRIGYMKARDYSRQSNEDPEDVELKVLNMCPHYKKLNSIYGEKYKIDEENQTDEDEYSPIEEGESEALDESLQKRQKKKIWTPKELDRILGYIIKHGELGKPSVLIYYTKLLERTKIRSCWFATYQKVLCLRRGFKRAKNYILQTNDDPKTIELTILRICPHYQKLNLIFGEEDQYDEDVELVVNKSLPQADIATKRSLGRADMMTTKYAIEHVIGSQRDSNSLLEQDLEIQREQFRQEMEFEKRKLQFHERKMQFEFEIQERRLLLEKQRVKFEQEQRMREFELTKLELENKTFDPMYYG